MKKDSMTVHEVSKLQYLLIEKLFDHYVFRREENGKFYVKVSPSQKRTIKQYLFISL